MSQWYGKLNSGSPQPQSLIYGHPELVGFSVTKFAHPPAAVSLTLPLETWIPGHTSAYPPVVDALIVEFVQLHIHAHWWVWNSATSVCVNQLCRSGRLLPLRRVSTMPAKKGWPQVQSCALLNGQPPSFSHCATSFPPKTEASHMQSQLHHGRPLGCPRASQCDRDESIESAAVIYPQEPAS